MSGDQYSKASNIEAVDRRGINSEVALVNGVERHLQGVADVS